MNSSPPSVHEPSSSIVAIATDTQVGPCPGTQGEQAPVQAPPRPGAPPPAPAHPGRGPGWRERGRTLPSARGGPAMDALQRRRLPFAVLAPSRERVTLRGTERPPRGPRCRPGRPGCSRFLLSPDKNAFVGLSSSWSLRLSPRRSARRTGGASGRSSAPPSTPAPTTAGRTSGGPCTLVPGLGLPGGGQRAGASPTPHPVAP